MGAVPRQALPETQPAPYDISAAGQRDGELEWVVSHDRAPIGRVRLVPVRVNGADITINLWMGARGNGRGTAAIRAVVCAAFDPRAEAPGLQLDMLHAHVWHGDAAPPAALARAGFYAAPPGLLRSRTSPSSYRHVEQVNPYDPGWTRDWGMPDRREVPPVHSAESLARFREASLQVITGTAMHFCVEAACPSYAPQAAS
ncbi:MAG TPA: hypothetical protein VLF71_00035 [Candidatus Saccharimonadales bacterium]|nr:hypothetical protein [Candidatus Saccharimonadales bacterium]